MASNNENGIGHLRALVPWLMMMMMMIDTLQAWMSSNRLRLNPTKTQFIWFGTRQQLAKILSRNGVGQNHQASQRPPAPLLLFPLCPRESTSVVFRGLAYSGLRED